MKNKPFKKILSVFLSFLMVLTSLVFVVPEIAPKAEAADTYASYHVRMTVYLKNVGKGGNIAIKYYPVKADGTLDKQSSDTYYMVYSLSAYGSNATFTLATDHWGSEGGSERRPNDARAYSDYNGPVPGWPYEIVLTRAGSWGTNSYIEITNLEIGDGTTYKTVLSGGSWSTDNGNKTITYNTTDTGIRPYIKSWEEPAVSSISGNTATEFTLANFAVSAFPLYSTKNVYTYDQYGVQFPGNISWEVTASQANGTTGIYPNVMSQSTGHSQARVYVEQTVEQNLPADTKDGKLVYNLVAKCGNQTDSKTVTLWCPKYTANYTKADGTTAATKDIGYYNNTYNNSSSIASIPNTATKYNNDGTHTVYSWPTYYDTVRGNITIKENGTSSGHSYGSWVTSADEHSQTCSVCGHVNSGAHDFEDWKTIGKTEHTKTCTTCGYVVTASHNWGAWVSDGNVQNGTHTRTCLDCGETESSVHTWNEGVVTTQPGCATPGVKTYTCTTPGCGATYTAEIAATGNHNFGGAYTIAGNSHRQYCQNGDVNCQAYQDTAHTWSDWTYENAVNHYRTCTVCKLTQSKETHEHNWGEGEVTKAPTCTEDGVRTYTCSACKGTKTDVEPKTGHTWGACTSNDNGTHTRKCTVRGCGAEETVACSNTTVNTTPATCTADAIKHYTCTDCGYTWDETQTGTMTGHYWLDYTVSDIFVENHTEYLAQAATCETAARYYNYCRDCGVASTVANYNQTAIIKGKETISENTLDVNMEFKGKSLGHAYTGAVVAKSGGTHAYQCVRFDACGSTGVGTTKDATETCSDSTPVVTPPTCTAPGYSTYECKCGNEWTADETEMIAHNWVSTANEAELEQFVMKSAADCDSKAVYYMNCSACKQSAEEIDDTKTFEFGSVRAHDWSAWTADEDVTIDTKDTTTHSRYCKYDDCDVEESNKHTWTSEETKAPTYEEKGEITYTCSVCSTTFTEEIAANVDAQAPTVAIKWGESTWNAILNTITFGTYVNYDIKLEISADDIGTGVDSVEYYVSNEALTEDAVKEIADWEAYDADNKLTISKENEEKYVVYAKVTDKAGNVSYAGTNGFVIDTTAPEIILTPALGGNDETLEYCGQVVVTATDANNVIATLNGYNVAIGNGLLVNSDGEHTVVVTDDAGNSSTVTFTVKLAHTWVETNTDNLKDAATCTTKATYWKVCSVCGAVSDTEYFEYGNALGHQDPTTYVVTDKADCENDGTKTAYCGRVNGDEVCNEVVGTQTIPAREHNMTDWIEVTPADCTTEGLNRKTCQNTEATDEYEACSHYEEDAIPATGHTWSEEVKDSVASPADCENDAVYYLGCEDCDAVATEADSKEGTVVVTWTDVDSKTGHAWDEGAYVSEADKPTCTEGGTLTYTCANENCPVGTYTEDVEATGHAWDDGAYLTEADKPTCTETGTFTYTCGNANCPVGTYTETTAALGHTEKEAVVENYKGASCGVAGSYDMAVYCDVCGEFVSSTTETIPALTHTLVKTEAVEAECEKEGNIAYWTCTTEGGCGEIYADENAEKAITLEETVVKASGHKTQYVKAVAPTCTEAGTVEHYKCLNGCGKLFVDVTATLEIDDLTGEPALDHEFTGEWRYSLTDNKHQRECSRCDEWSEQTDCTFDASYEATVNTDAVHSHKQTCECGNSKELSCTPVKGKVHEDPTCGDENDYGWTDYSCAKCSNTWEGDKTYKLHKCVEKEKVTGDCVTKSYMVYECTNDGCDYEYTQDLDYEATRHVGDAEAGTRVVIKNAKKATCDEEGYTGDIYCECGVLLKKGETIPEDETAHQWGTPAVQPGTCITDGYEVSYCDDCGEQRTVSTGKDPSVHMNVKTGVEVKPTCTTTGYTGAEVCDDCGTVVTPGKIVDALGHNIGPWEIITMPSKDGTTPGYAERRCLVCGGEKETREDFYYADVYYVVYHDYNGVRLTAPRNYIKGDYTLRPEKNPVRPEDNKYTYEFIGWDYTDAYLDSVVKSMTVVAQYAATEKSYTVKFYDANGNMIPVSTTGPVKYSQIVSSFDGETPTKAPDAEYTYTFDGWEISCDRETGVASVTPRFTKKAIEKEEQSGGFFAWLIALIKSLLAKIGIVF